jgi:2-polyprenyl-3-methyl-5-hydroxy-6-metoxy-1,4-benzoquinol methylase
MNPVIEREAVQSHFNSLAAEYETWKQKASYYYGYVMAGLQDIIPPGQRVLELGCGTGAILDSLKPSYGVGIDLSPEMVAVARQKRPHLHFETGDIEHLALKETFDYVVMVDIVEHLSNLRGSFKNLGKILKPGTVLVSSSVNPLWAPILHLAEYFKLKMPEGDHRWPSLKELQGLSETSGFEILSVDHRMILPKQVPWVSDRLNAAYPRQGPLARLALIQILSLGVRS